MESSQNQEANSSEDADKTKSEDKKEEPDNEPLTDKDCDTKAECCVKESLKLFESKENNIEQCEITTDLHFNISRSSDISKQKEELKESASSPTENVVCKESEPPSLTASTSKSEMSGQEDSDQEKKEFWMRDPEETSDENEYSDGDFESLDFNDSDLMEVEEENEEEDEEEEAEKGEEEEEKEEETPKKKVPVGPIEVVDLSSDSENFKDKEQLPNQDEENPVSNVMPSTSDCEALVPIDLSVDNCNSVPAAQSIKSPTAPLPVVDVHHIIPLIDLSDDENEENADAEEKGELPDEPPAASSDRELCNKRVFEDQDKSNKKSKKDEDPCA